MATQWVDLSVDVQLLMSHPKSALLGILQMLKGWETVIEDDITVEQFSGAMTNMVYRCGLLQHGKEVQVVLMRVHASSSDLFDRQEEIATFKGVSQAGLGPHLLLLFSNGRVEEFLSQHVTLAAADIHDPTVSAAIASTLSTFHTKMSKVMGADKLQQAAGAVQLWDRLKLWLDLVTQVTSLSELQQLGMLDLEQEIEQLRQQLSQQHPCWVALCHNDLQYGNIMALAGATGLQASTTTPAAHNSPAVLLQAAPADASEGHGSSGGSSSLTQQLKALGLDQQHTTDAGAAAGISPRLELLQRGVGVDAPSVDGGRNSSSAAALPSPAKEAGPESLTSEDAASLSNVSVAGSAAPSVSGLSAFSAGAPSAAAGAQPPPSPAAAAAAGAGGALSPAAASAPQAAPLPNPRVSSLTDSASASSLQVLGRSPHRTVQLPDGSLVLPGMRARPRGQSPEPARGKRPDASNASFTGSISGASRGGSGEWASGPDGSAAAAGGLGSFHSSSRLMELMPQQLQPPSAAAVLRHQGSSDEGDLLLQMVPDDPEALAANGLLRRRRISHADSAAAPKHASGGGSESDTSSSSSSSDSDSSTATTSAADSAEAEDLLLVPEHLKARYQQQQQQQGAGDGAAGGAGNGLAAERAAAVSRSARKYREFRRARLQPAEGLEFPTLVTSDAEGQSSSDSDDSSGVMTDDSSPADGMQANPCIRSRGRSAASCSSRQPAAATGPMVPAAVSAESSGGDQAAADGPATGITFIDYEYSGFNPIAYDIANHWCEWAADYHTEEPHVLDFSRLPDHQQQVLFVEAYLRALLSKLGVELPACALAAAAAPDGSTSPMANSSSSMAAASPEPACLSSLAGFKLTAGLNPSSSQKSEPAWSTLSSRGGSVISFPETDAGWETASQSSVMTARSHKTDATGADGEEGGAAAATPTAARAAAAAAGGSSKPSPSSRDLQDVWCWLEYATNLKVSSSSTGGRELSAAGWHQLVGEVVAAADAYMAASHLLWTLWGLIQAKVSDVAFDFTGYGQQRWRMYLQTRPAALQHKQ